jgi:hypothetical protein
MRDYGLQRREAIAAHKVSQLSVIAPRRLFSGLIVQKAAAKNEMKFERCMSKNSRESTKETECSGRQRSLLPGEKHALHGFNSVVSLVNIRFKTTVLSFAAAEHWHWHYHWCRRIRQRQGVAHLTGTRCFRCNCEIFRPAGDSDGRSQSQLICSDGSERHNWRSGIDCR